MRKLINALAIAGLVTAGSVATLGITSASAEMRELRFAEFGPNRGTRAAAIQWLDTELRKRSGDTLGLNITWGGALLGARRQLRACRTASPTWLDRACLCAGQLVAYEVVDTLQFGDE